MQLREVMTDNVTFLNQNNTLVDAAKVMRDLNVGVVPVCNENNQPVGIITDRDIVIRNAAEGGDVNTTPVQNVMSKDLIYATPDMSSQEAAQLMSEKQIRRLPVVENGNLVGIVALGDLAVDSKTDMEAGEALSNISIPSKPAK